MLGDVEGFLAFMVGPGTAQALANIGNAFWQMGYGKATVLPTFKARNMQLPFDPQTFVAGITDRALAGISPTAAQQVGNGPADVDATLPQVFTAP